MQLKAVALAALTTILAGPALASCGIAIDTGGALGISIDGKYVGSDQPGGVPAVVLVTSTGPSTLTVSAPTYTQLPAGYAGTGDTLEVAYAGAGLLGGITQPYTAGGSHFTVPNLLGLGAVALTINNRATTASGFRAGPYGMRTVVTCS